MIKQAWYLVGLSDGRDQVKCYRVIRFKSLRMTDHDADVPTEFDVRQHFGNAWAVFRGASSFDVRLRFEASVATQVTETNWHHTQEVMRHRDGSATLTFTVVGLEEIVEWIMGWADSVRVESPTELLVKKLVAAVDMNR